MSSSQVLSLGYLTPFAGGEEGMPDMAIPQYDIPGIHYRGQGRRMTQAEIDALEADRFAREERKRAQERAQENALLAGPVRSWDAKLADITINPDGTVNLPVDMWRNADSRPGNIADQTIGKEQIEDAIRRLAELGGRDTLNRSVNNMLQQAKAYYRDTPRGDGTWDRNIEGGLIPVDQRKKTSAGTIPVSFLNDSAWKATWDDIADEVLDAKVEEGTGAEVQSFAGGEEGMPGMAIPQDGTIPENLPQFWKDRYGEYQALSPELQQIILLNGIQNYTDLDPYQAALQVLSTQHGESPTVADGEEIDGEETDGEEIDGEEILDDDKSGWTSNFPDPLQLEGFAATDLQDILNIFYANPDRYISEIPVFEDVFNEAGQFVRQKQVGTQQVLSPVAQAALQAFSTQRGAASADVASRFGTATPFGVIAGMGGETAAADAKSLAELQARAGVNNPFAALGTGSTIEDIGSILRGGLDVEQQLALAGLQARGGISPEQRLAEQRMALLPQLFQTSPQALGGLQRVLGEQQLQQALTPFFSAGSFQPVPLTQTQPGSGINPVYPPPFAGGEEGMPDMAPPQYSGINPVYPPPFAGGEEGMPGMAPPQYGEPVEMMPFNQPVTQNISSTTQPVSAVSPGFRPTVGQYQRADLFDRGGFEAEAGMSGKQLTPFLQEVTPLGASTRPGGLGAQRTTRFTY